MHPLETAGHPNYNGYENFHCSPRAYWDYSSFDNRDLTIVVYDAAVNEDDFITIGIEISDFVDYLNKWIGFIDEIIFAIKKYEKKSVEEYRNIPMKSVTDFAMYSEYIAYLKSEYIKRGNAHQLECFDDYIRVFDTGMSHQENELKCELYKNAIKLAMDFLAKRLQNMDKGKGETTGIKYDVPWNYTELFIELHWPDNLKANEHNIRYCIEKMVCRSDSFNDRMEEIKDWINQYVKFDNTESYNEMYTLVMTALYLNSLNNSCVLNRNIPNELLFRKKILTEKEYLELIDISNSLGYNR